MTGRETHTDCDDCDRHHMERQILSQPTLASLQGGLEQDLLSGQGEDNGEGSCVKVGGKMWCCVGSVSW